VRPFRVHAWGMRSRGLVAFFQRAVLLVLATPACGGSTSPVAPADAGVTPIPSTPCAWVAGVRAACSWSLSFAGDATSCAGFAGTGTAAQCVSICGVAGDGQSPDFCSVQGGGDAGAGTVYCDVSTGPCTPTTPPGNGGRRPGYFASLGFDAPARGREVGVHFARVACMEAGSVEAFRGLRDELIAHRAPRRLVRAASRAFRDELRHVRVTSALARRFGEEPIPKLPSPARAVRPLLAMALENAVEGCVRETYSALECAWQAESARDPVVRATMKRVARDELRHLALAWEVHAWAMGRLDRAERARVRGAQHAELAVLFAEVSADPHASLVAAAGLPRGFQSRALVSAIASRVAA
jgi:hypothetical protein